MTIGRPIKSLSVADVRSYGSTRNGQNLEITMSVKDGPGGTIGRDAHVSLSSGNLIAILTHLIEHDKWGKVIQAMTAEAQKVQQEIDNGQVPNSDMHMLVLFGRNRRIRDAAQAAMEENDG